MIRKLRAAGLLALAAGLVVTITVVHQTDRDNKTGAAATPTSAAVPTGTPASEGPTPQGPSPVVPTPTATPDPHGQHREPSEIPIRTATTTYLRTFFDRKMPTEQWRTRLADLSTTTHAETMSTVPRVAVPHVTLSSTKVIRLASSAATVEATLSDRSLLHVGLVLDERGWKVSRVLPYRKVVAQ